MSKRKPDPRLLRRWTWCPHCELHTDAATVHVCAVVVGRQLELFAPSATRGPVEEG